MKCDRTQQCLLYLWGEMTASESATFAEHLNQCSVCKVEVEQLEPLVRSMQSLEPEQLPDDLVQRIRTRLTIFPQVHPRRLRITPRRALAVAASIVLVAGATILWRTMLARPTAPDAGSVAQGMDITDDEFDELVLAVADDLEALSQELNGQSSTLTAEIADVSWQIEYLLQEVEDELAPDESDNGPADEQGSRLRTTGMTAAT